ncbi:MAG: hypothetical protein WAU14_06660, partial [Dokdonella sp.]
MHSIAGAQRLIANRIDKVHGAGTWISMPQRVRFGLDPTLALILPALHVQARPARMAKILHAGETNDS